MYSPQRIFIALLVAAAAILAFTTPVDYAWTAYLATHKAEAFAEAMGRSIFEGELPGGGDPVVVYLIVVVGFYYATLRAGHGTRLYRLRPAAGFLVVAGLVSALFTVHSLKWMLGRARPGEVFGGHLPFTPWFVPGPHIMSQGIFRGSFPSGHTALAFAPFALVYVLGGRSLAHRNAPAAAAVGLMVFAYTAIMGTARCMTSSHWVSDVAGSVAISMAAMHLMYFHLLRVPEQEAAAGLAPPGNALPAGWELGLAGCLALAFAGVTFAVCGLRIVWHQGLDGWALMVPAGVLAGWAGIRYTARTARRMMASFPHDEVSPST